MDKETQTSAQVSEKQIATIPKKLTRSEKRKKKVEEKKKGQKRETDQVATSKER